MLSIPAGLIPCLHHKPNFLNTSEMGPAESSSPNGAWILEHCSLPTGSRAHVSMALTAFTMAVPSPLSCQKNFVPYFPLRRVQKFCTGGTIKVSRLATAQPRLQRQQTASPGSNCPTLGILRSMLPPTLKLRMLPPREGSATKTTVSSSTPQKSLMARPGVVG